MTSQVEGEYSGTHEDWTASGGAAPFIKPNLRPSNFAAELSPGSLLEKVRDGA